MTTPKPDFSNSHPDPLATRVAITLKESEEKFRSVVEQSPNGIYLLSPEGIIIEWNQSMERITELSHEETVGKTMLEVMFSLMRDEVKSQQMFQRVSNGTQRYIHMGKTSQDKNAHNVAIENIIQCKSGARRHIEITLIRIQLEKGALAGGIVQDITLRKRADLMLKRNLEEMTALSAIASRGSQAGNQRELLDLTLGLICQSIHSDLCYIRFFEEDDSQVSCLSLACEPDQLHTVPPFSNRLIDEIHAGRESYRIEDLQAGGVRPYQPGAISALCAPLRVSQEIVGVLYTERAGMPPFSAEDETLFRTISGQLSTALAKVRLMEMLENKVADRTRQLSILYEILAIANETMDLQIIMDRSLQKVLSVARCAQGAIYLSDERSGKIDLVAFHNLREEELKEIELGFASYARDEKTNGEGEEEPARAAPPVFDKYFPVPLRAHEKIMGVVVIPRNPMQQMRHEDRALLISIADQIGVAVETYRLRKQAEEAAILEERERLSRELHDSVTQLLYSLTLFSKTGLEFAGRGDLAGAQVRLSTIGEISQQALKEMRLMVYELKPQMLEEDGFEQAIRRRLEAVEGQLGIQTSLEITPLKIPPKLERELYFIIQEALNNVLKHSKATQVKIHLTAKNRVIELIITDNGVGFLPEMALAKGGMGLTNMQKSIEHVNGAFQMKSSPGEGTCICVSVAY